jgi:hypothetical protein
MADAMIEARSRPAIRTMKKVVSRLIVSSVHRLGQDGNLYVMARKPLSVSEGMCVK